MKTAKEKSEWFERLKEATTGFNRDQIEKTIEYVRWVKIQKVNGDFEETFSKFKNGPFKPLGDSVGEQPSEDTIWAEIINEARHYNGSPHDLKNITEHFKKFYSVHLI